jgi:hypothetical protein
MTARFALLAAAAAIVALVAAPVGVAHGTQPRLEISAERTARGAPLTVRGYDFAYEDVVALMLIGSEEDWRIGTVTADVEGSFAHTIVLPQTMREGEYAVSARTAHHAVESAALDVSGLAASPGDTERRDQADALAPSATSGVQASPSPGIVRVAHTSDRDLMPLIVVVLTVLLVAGAFVARRAQARRDTVS